MSDAPIELNGVFKKFNARAGFVLKGVDLTVPAGSVVGLLGRNGEGKTTLIKTALGLLRPTLGEARVFGRSSWKLDEEDKARLGYVPQVVSMYPWMRVGQMIDYTAAFYRKWNYSLVQALLRDWQLDEKQKIGALSMGTLQKLSIILALGHEPQLLVLDEPAASLDPSARREFLKKLLEIAAGGGRTILFSTHITSDLERVADRVAILRRGRIAYHGELDELKDRFKRLHVTSRGPIEPSFNIPGALRVRVHDNEALVSVKAATPEMVEKIERDYAASVRVEDLNLEDIFLEMHHD